MRRIQKINIPEPCHQSWQAMTAGDGGRHCESCSKTVVDFTRMTNDEIINYLSVSRHVCGRIHEQQLDSVNMLLTSLQPQNKGGWTKWVMAAVLFVSTAYNRANAQATIHQTEQTGDNPRQNEGFPLGKIAMPDSAKYQTITGIIVGDDDNLPLPGVSVFVDKSKLGTQTNDYGKFTIRVPVSAKTITINYVGYERKVIQLKKINKLGTIQLKIKAAMLGGLGVTRPSMLNQIFSRLA